MAKKMTNRCNSNEWAAWPLSNILEPHETNDVLLLKKGRTIVILPEFPSVTPSSNFQGNQRFLDLLRDRQEDYLVKSPMEKPLVALDLLRQWRAQEPPGRFLVPLEPEERPQHWKDVGDKEARSRISKALKTMSSETHTTSRCNSTISDASNTTQTTANSTTTGTNVMPQVLQRLDSDRPLPRSIPQVHATADPSPKRDPHLTPTRSFPKMEKPQKLTSRRISAQIHAANAQGKLYGRWKEQELLLQILKDASVPPKNTNNNKVRDRPVDFVLIQGPLGVGKTALARTLMNPMALADHEEFKDVSIVNLDDIAVPSFFLQAKFEQLMNPNPYNIFLDLFHQFCLQICNHDNGVTLIQQCRDKIQRAFPEDLDIIFNLVPSLAFIFASDDFMNPNCCGPAKQSTKGAPKGVLMAQKVKSYFVTLLQIAASLVPSHPLVVVLDDLHWANEASMDILTTILSDVVLDGSSGGVIFCATINVDGNHRPKPFYHRAMETLKARPTIQFHKVELNNVQQGDVRDFLAETLDCPYDKVEGLCAFLFTLTQGNPMFLSAILGKMQHKGFIFTDETTGEWTYDLDHIESNFCGAKTVFEVIRMKVSSFPKPLQETLKYIASLGSAQIDTSILEMLSPESVPSHLDVFVEFGMLNQVDGLYYFNVDGFRNAIYNLDTEDDRAALHLEIAQKLWKFLDARQDKEFLYILLNQLMLGDSLLTQDSDRHEVAVLCLRAGEVAAKTLGFQTASVYLEHGISILPKDKMWGRDNYDLSLRLHNACVEVCYCNAKFQRLDELIETILEHCRVFEDSLVARSTQIFAWGSRQRIAEAVDSALGTLKELGEFLPAYPRAAKVFAYYRKTMKMLKGKTDEAILQMRPMTDRKKLAAMQIFNHMFLYAFYSRSSLASLVCLRMIQLTMEFGISEVSSVAFTFFATVLVAGPSIKEGLRFGRLGLKLYEKYKNEAWLSRVWSMYYGVVFITKEPISRALEPLEHAYRTGLRTGDIEYGIMSGMFWIYRVSGSFPLTQLKKELDRLISDMKLTGHRMALSMCQPIYKFVMEMTRGLNEDQGRTYLAVIAKENGVRESTETVGLWMKYTTTASACMFGDFDSAFKSSIGIDAIYMKHGYASTAAAGVLFFECFVRLQQAKKGFLERVKGLLYVRRRLKLLEKWAHMAPENMLDLYHILVAELAVVEGKREKASLHYRSAIIHATTERHLGIGAFANEWLAKYFLETGDNDSALPLLHEAFRLYEEWGALAKVEHLQEFCNSTISNFNPNKQV